MKIDTNFYGLYIKKVWVLHNNDSVSKKSMGSLVGDGCLELIFVSGNGYITKLGSNIQKWKEGIYLGGHIDEQFELEVLPQTQITFVKLNWWTAGLISGFDFRQSRNQTIPLIELDKDLYRKLANKSTHKFTISMLHCLNQSMEKKQSHQRDFELIRYSSAFLNKNFSDFKISKKKLLNEINISSKSLETKFGRSVELTPLKFVNTIRFREISEQIYHHKNRPSLTNLTYKFGFYDQAHFIRACHKAIGFTPSNLSKENCFMTNSRDRFRYYTI